jgi:hypothetical protein
MVTGAKRGIANHVAQALSQMEILIVKKRLDHKKSESECTEAVKFHETLSDAERVKLHELDPADVNVALELQQRWLRQFMLPEEINGTIVCLLGYYHTYAEKSAGSLEVLRKGKAGQRSLGKDEAKEDTVAYYLIYTMYMLLRASVEIQNHDCEQAFSVIATSSHGSNREFLLQFLIERLTMENSPAIRNASALCLSILSLKAEFLSIIVNQFLTAMDSSKSDDEEREYASYQRAISDLAFGFGNDRIEITMEYLFKLSIKMKKVERGVLRQEICYSLKDIFKKLLDPADEILLQELNLMENSDRAAEFWDIYKSMFECVSRWAKKSSHSAFCYDLMWQMACLGNKNFLKIPDVENMLSALVSGFKKDDLKYLFMGYTRNYIAELNILFVRENPQKFIEQVRELLSYIFSKKKVLYY